MPHHSLEITDQKGKNKPHLYFNKVHLTISTQENFPQKEKFVNCDWQRQIFCCKKLKIFNYIISIIFLENFLSMEIFLEWI